MAVSLQQNINCRMPLMRKLITALAMEKTADMRPRTGSYADLLRVMAQYSEGTGPAPSVEQFEEWRDEVAQRLLNTDLADGSQTSTLPTDHAS